jgi:hypothetical protein
MLTQLAQMAAAVAGGLVLADPPLSVSQCRLKQVLINIDFVNYFMD